ncbi:MAG: hypothetical protein Q9178_006922 [Gyalolechia marmorata]
MFTGIVECIGTISSLSTSSSSGATLTIITPTFLLTDAHLGDSISINGTCLTITSFTPTSFTVGVSPETLRRTNLGRLAQNSTVNLERAVSAATRMGGHFVQGHVDTTATIVGVKEDGEARVFRFRPRDAGVMRFVVEKGYVTIDGASLTVTREKVVTAGKKVGEEVNVEVDMVGKYVEKSVRGYLEGLDGEGKREGGGVLEKMVERIVERKLKGRWHEQANGCSE